MSSATYQTKVPSTLVPYCEAMGFLLGQAERHLYSSLSRGEKPNTLKKEYQIRFGINARQFNSVHSSIKGKIESRKECHFRLLNELTGRIKQLEKSVKKLRSQLKSNPPACGLKGKPPRKLWSWKLHQKKRQLTCVTQKLAFLKTQNPALLPSVGEGEPEVTAPLSQEELRCTHKSSGLCMRSSCPLVSPNWRGTLKFRFPPSRWGARGAKCSRQEVDQEMCVHGSPRRGRGAGGVSPAARSAGSRIDLLSLTCSRCELW